ncbi:MAG TPA: phosphoribosylaminoimidazolesuccinocarboxamide synthase [Candidatus Hydrogenedentes bacterium]|nr:phosphoribosylaminoimidazolesuccinocarboxamide synthase [Candidatus Hydrogenedentota bacterium]HOL77775.1 phosphoribosylaminoimidazolesuccinocarboxamide synthase [Candidatus Hydrogenedentota bacterium]HPO86411.1 phosphoribosylaminoimidazolesuccinocarboxamide synthase [Candidatus Hydrogenedentota bacterium]
MKNSPLLQTSIPGREPLARGKVRDIYDLGDRLVIVATDRISAFDWVNPVGIPDKGKVLTQISLFWFEYLKDIVPNHLLSVDLSDLPAEFQKEKDQLEGRTMLVRKCSMLPVEFVVRGYLAGSAWKEYKTTGKVCGIELPKGLQESSRLEKPIFTPATKATEGHDINITAEQTGDIIGKALLEQAAAAALALYDEARAYAETKGLILCDTKFEFGLYDGKLMLADEVLTPDSSRFWPADQYQPGRAQPSFDKQFVRDWLESTNWDKNSPPPPLPEDVVMKTREKYIEAYERLTGRHFGEN